MKRYATLLVGLFCVVTVAGCFGPTQEPVYSVAPPQWLVGQWETSFDLAYVTITHDNVIVDIYNGANINLKTVTGSVTDESPSDRYYKIKRNGDTFLSFQLVDSWLFMRMGGELFTLYPRD